VVAHIKKQGAHKVVYDKVKSGLFKVGDKILLSKALSDTFVYTGTTAISGVGVSSSQGRKATSSGELRNFVVGDVLKLENDRPFDDKHNEHWFVVLVSLNEPSTGDPTALGMGRWLYGQDCFRKAGGGKSHLFDHSREVYLSDYHFEIKRDTVLGKCRMFPEFLDSGREDDVVITKFFAHVAKTLHLLTPPKVGKSEDLTKVLTLYRANALRAQPVSTYFLTNIFVLFLQRALRMFSRATFCDKLYHDILYHALGSSALLSITL
jgi:hypothetical protein